MSTAVFGAQGFKARSGRLVKPQDDGSVRFELAHGFLDRNTAFDAEEFFQAKRDAELGRWRWPENPEYVVYPVGSGTVVTVLKEANGNSGQFTRELISGFGELLDTLDAGYSRAARAYFAAHPDSKPWHHAKQPEVWVLTHVKGETGPFIVDGNRFESGRWSLPLDSESITDGRRIWPVDETAPDEAPRISSQAGLASIRSGL